MSTGASAVETSGSTGIIIGVIIGVILLFVLALVFMRRRRMKIHPQQANDGISMTRNVPSGLLVEQDGVPVPMGTPANAWMTKERSPFFLASAPVSALDDAKRLVQSRGGEYAAGDKEDIFNNMTLNDQESWRVGWKGKVEMCINLLKRHNPGQQVTALAIAGGPACDWERGELRNVFCRSHPELVLKQLGDIEDLQLWLDKYHPASPGNDMGEDAFEATAAEEDERLCKVCLERPKSSRALVPCGHICLCDECIVEMQAIDAHFACPICRTNVKSIVIVRDVR